MPYIPSIVLALLFPALALSATLSGRVLRVDNGNTVTIVDPYNVQHTVRLQDIKTPGLNLPEGRKAKETLERMVAGRHVVIDYAPDSGYKAPTGRIFMQGEDINLRQLREGMGVFDPSRYTRDPRVQEAYETAQGQAEKSGLGVWRGEGPKAGEGLPAAPPAPQVLSPNPSAYPPLGDNPRFTYHAPPTTSAQGPQEYAPLPERRRVPYGHWALETGGADRPDQVAPQHYPPPSEKQRFTAPPSASPGPFPPAYGGPLMAYPGPFRPPYPPIRPWSSRGNTRNHSGSSAFCPIGW